MTADPKVLIELIKILEPLTSDVRQRAVNAAMIYLGEQHNAQAKETTLEEPSSNELRKFASKAQKLMKQNAVSTEQLEQVFHFNGGGYFELLDVPGKGKRERTLNTYMLFGLGNLLATNEQKFNDDDARAVCKTLGCYDESNHAAILKEMRTNVTGNKKSGWTITNPGIKNATGLVKQIANSGND